MPIRASAQAVPSACNALPRTLAPHSLRSLLRCHLTWGASAHPSRQTLPRPSPSGTPCWLISPSLLKCQRGAHQAGIGPPCPPGRMWESCSELALVSATRLLPRFPSQVPLTPGLSPQWRAPAPGPALSLLHFVRGRQGGRGPIHLKAARQQGWRGRRRVSSARSW